MFWNAHWMKTNTRQRLDQRLKNGSVSDGRWEIYEPQKKKFDPVTEVASDHHFIIDSARPLSEQITRIIEIVFRIINSNQKPPAIT